MLQWIALKGSSAKKFTFLQTSYFGLEWGVRGVQNILWYPLHFFWGGMFGPSEPNDPIPTQNMRFEAKYFFLAEDLFNEAATNMNYAALYVK